jgi:hypothetical protein
VSGTHIGAALRRLVATWARRCCEYCLVHEEDTFFGYEVDHVISEKHGGATAAENLAFACLPCNRRKGSDIASIDPGSGSLVRLFNPRTDRWMDHCSLSADGLVIHATTAIGVVTERILQLNDVERHLERAALRVVGRYPPP